MPIWLGLLTTHYPSGRRVFNTCCDTAGQVPPSASAYLVLLAALPALHTCALRLMQTLLWAGQAALLLHHTSMARLLSSLLQQVAASAAADSAPAAMQLRQQVTATGPPLCVDTARQAIRHLAHFTAEGQQDSAKQLGRQHDTSCIWCNTLTLQLTCNGVS